MSVLPAEVQGALTQLLQALSSPDNALRSQAEEQLNNDWTPNRPDILLMGLVEQIQAAQDPSVCSVLALNVWSEVLTPTDKIVCRCPLSETVVQNTKSPHYRRI